MVKYNKIKIIDQTYKDDFAKNYFNICWDHFPENDECISIISYIDQYGVELRDEYLNLTNKISNVTINNKSFLDALTLKSGLSFWWVSQINEKCNISKSPDINDSIKLLALNKILSSNSINCINYMGTDKKLASTLAIFCRSKKIDFQVNKFNSIDFRGNFFKPLISFIRFFLYSYFFSKRVKIHEYKDAYDYCFFGYLFPSDLKKYVPEKYCGPQWGNLPILTKYKKSLWVNIPINIDCLTDKDVIVNLRNIRDSSININHITIFNEAGFVIFFKTIFQFFYIFFISARYRSKLSLSIPDLNIIHLLNKSFFGSNALVNLYYSNLIEALSKNIAHVKKTIYLQEGQSWESALNFFFKKNLKSEMVGYAHSAVRFWDLKFFQSKKISSPVEQNFDIHPDIVCVNSYYAYNLLKNAGFYKNIKPVEALRYSYLEENYASRKIESGAVRLLVVADGVERHYLQQINLIKSFLKIFDGNIKITLKPHPAFPILLNESDIEVSCDAIDTLLRGSDVVVVGPTTTVAAEAYSLGVLVVTINDGSTLNFSPLYELEGANFISTASELVAFVKKFIAGNSINNTPQPYFYIDRTYKKWGDILEVKSDYV